MIKFISTFSETQPFSGIPGEHWMIRNLTDKPRTVFASPGGTIDGAESITIGPGEYRPLIRQVGEHWITLK